MKKWGKLSLGMLLAASLLAGCGNNNDNAATTDNAAGNTGAAATKTLTLGTSADFLHMNSTKSSTVKIPS